MGFIEYLKKIFSSYEHELEADSDQSYDTVQCPKDEHIIPDDIFERFKKKGLNGGYKACRDQSLPYAEYEKYMSMMIYLKYKKKCYGEILSFIYDTGDNFNWHVIPLLRKLYETDQFDTFLKQAHRFNIYKGLSREINSAIKILEIRGQEDAPAWRKKFDEVKAANSLNKKH